MVEIKVGEVIRGFVFGTNTIRIFRALTGISAIEDIFNGIGNKDQARNQIDHVMFINDFLWACAQDYCRRKSLPMDFTTADVSDWVDEAGLPVMKDVLGELMASYAAKNRKAPTEGPPPNQQEQP